ncbi:hypothetical protein L208DRAFT_365290 [Tricholoma matsutake]|nr:hypothetical protein L208DRAFT_365290 [Tricholoma matsutake 945]
MRSSLVLLAGAVVSASAASSGLWIRQQLPTDGVQGCQPNDYNCHCNSQLWINTMNTCIVQQCSGVDLQDAISAEKSLCAAVGVGITVTPTVTASGSSSTTTPAPTRTSNAALANGVTRTMFFGVVALGLGMLNDIL